MDRSDIEELLRLRADVERLLERDRWHWFAGERRAKEAAQMLCDQLAGILAKERIWKAIDEAKREGTESFLGNLEEIMEFLIEALVKLDVDRELASLIVSDVYDSIDLLAIGGDGGDIRHAVERAKALACNSAKSGRDGRTGWTAKRLAKVVSGLAIASVGAYVGEPLLVGAGAALAGISADQLQRLIDRFFGGGG